jgi:hypothetical protein
LKIRVGVVGPEDSVGQIMRVGVHFNELHLIPYVYERTEEAEEIIGRNKQWVDQWLFSGQAPYYFALAKGIITQDEASYVPLNGSSLLGTLLEAFVQEGRILYKLSLDTIQEDEVEKARNSFSLSELTIYTNSYFGYVPAEEIIRSHQKLYENGQIDVAVTCINAVYVALKEMGIPTYRVVQSELAVHRALGYIKEKGQTSWYRKSQLVIMGVEIIFPSTSSDEYQFSFKQKHQELELKRVLLDLAEEINGSIVQIGDGLHFIYTTRGEMDLFTKHKSLHSIMDEISVNSRLHIRIGLGYGLTVLEAEQNVRIALAHARTYIESVVVMINEDKEVIVKLDENEQVSYPTRSHGEDWELLFKDASISATLVSKIESLANHYGQSTITSNDLSRWLKSTDRNARRILAEMERIGIAKVSGEESGQRGRPRKIYEIQSYR